MSLDTFSRSRNQVVNISGISSDRHVKEIFGIYGNTVAVLQKELDYYPKTSEIYTRHGVTPFVSLPYVYH